MQADIEIYPCNKEPQYYVSKKIYIYILHIVQLKLYKALNF